LRYSPALLLYASLIRDHKGVRPTPRGPSGRLPSGRARGSGFPAQAIPNI
jgi:hypothetical protein